MSFLDNVTSVPVARRVACFDNDGLPDPTNVMSGGTFAPTAGGESTQG